MRTPPYFLQSQSFGTNSDSSGPYGSQSLDDPPPDIYGQIIGLESAGSSGVWPAYKWLEITLGPDGEFGTNQAIMAGVGSDPVPVGYVLTGFAYECTGNDDVPIDGSYVVQMARRGTFNQATGLEEWQFTFTNKSTLTVRRDDDSARIDPTTLETFTKNDGFTVAPTATPKEALIGLLYSKVCERLYSYASPQTLRVVTKVCQTKDADGFVRDVQYETRTITLPACATIGDPVCFDASDACCSPVTPTDCCSNEMRNTLFVSATGSPPAFNYSCFDCPDSVTGGVTFPIVYDAINEWWLGTGGCGWGGGDCFFSMTVKLYCVPAFPPYVGACPIDFLWLVDLSWAVTGTCLGVNDEVIVPQGAITGIVNCSQPACGPPFFLDLGVVSQMWVTAPGGFSCGCNVSISE